MAYTVVFVLYYTITCTYQYLIRTFLVLFMKVITKLQVLHVQITQID